ncbi:MAG: TetR/AcrR family transcriptional regulator [Parvibaculaceae bacterium]|nr:TetR/AcrR family transcriptional regulator [Parvibaculaceae bacterium]
MAYKRTDAVAARLAQTRRQILKAARELVAEGGFNSAQVTEVAKKSGFATGTLYRYFTSKEDLCRQVFREVSTKEMNFLSTIAQGSGAPLERLEKVLRTFADRAVRGRRLAFALLSEPVDVHLAEERARFRQTHASIFAGLLDEAVEAGDIEPLNTAIAAAAMAGAVPTALIGPLAPQSHLLDADPARTVDEIVHFCLAAIGADTTAIQPAIKNEQRFIA